MAEFLLEIGLEEVPARMLAAAQAELEARVVALMERERLLASGSRSRSFSTPRRLAVVVDGIVAVQLDSEEQLIGPAWSVAFKEGAPMPAAHAFAKKAGIAVEALEQTTTPKGAYVSARLERKGRAAAELLSEQLPKEIGALAWPKNMYWRAGRPERFVRPVKWLVALLDETVLPMEFAGVKAGRRSRGHRVLWGAEPVTIGAPGSYDADLERARVLVDVNLRRHRIRKALDRVTRNMPGTRWREDEALVETVTHLTEWPTVLLGGFAPEFLALPEEVLVTVMRDHQKYFALEDAEGRLAPHFLTVLNTETDEAGETTIRHGNERVLRARFNDAQFFWDFDQRVPLAERIALLAKVTFQKDLGSYAQKTARTRTIAATLGALCVARGAAIDMDALDRASTLAKTDLTTELVKEFTELQGVVGGLYARAQAAVGDAHGEAVAQAIYWQYMPSAIGDAIPPTAEGQVLGLSDRIGTVVDMFGIGLAPTGSKDPYALRRAANAIVRILAGAGLPLTLSDLLDAAGAEEPARTGVSAFLEERLSFYLRDFDGLPADVVSAVLAADAARVADAEARARALASVRGSEDFAAIAAAWKRTRNILSQAGTGAHMQRQVAEDLLHEDAERALWKAVSALAPEVEKLRAQGAYVAALERIAALRPHVDRFFDTVMVMAEDRRLRENRLTLLATIVRELGRIADFSEIAQGAAGA